MRVHDSLLSSVTPLCCDQVLSASPTSIQRKVKTPCRMWFSSSAQLFNHKISHPDRRGRHGRMKCELGPCARSFQLIFHSLPGRPASSSSHFGLHVLRFHPAFACFSVRSTARRPADDDGKVHDDEGVPSLRRLQPLRHTPDEGKLRSRRLIASQKGS